MKTYTNQYTLKIYQILVPLIGDLMAVGVLKAQTQKIGINEEQITTKNLSQLATGIKQGLVIFLGSGLAQQISKKIEEL